MSLPTKSISELKKKYECVFVYMYTVCVCACMPHSQLRKGQKTIL